MGHTRPYDGVVLLLDELLKRDVPMGIVSNKPAKLVDALVRHFKWQKYFKTWLGGDSAARAKPSHEPLWLAREHCGLPTDHPMVMVGDGDQDILAAKAAQCLAVWCSWGFNGNPTKEYPSLKLDHPRDLLLTITNV